jgi:hypothetical protein
LDCILERSKFGIAMAAIIAIIATTIISSIKVKPAVFFMCIPSMRFSKTKNHSSLHQQATIPGFNFQAWLRQPACQQNDTIPNSFILKDLREERRLSGCLEAAISLTPSVSR